MFLIRSLDIGGAQRQLIELATGLQYANWSVKVLVFYSGGELEANLIERGVRVESLTKGGRWDILGFSFRLLRALRRARPDVLHGYLGTSNLLATAMKPLVPNMRVVWSVRASNVNLKEYDWLARVGFKAECWLSRFADLVICNSTAGRDFHAASGYPANRMVVIPNGIDCDQFRPDPDARDEMRRRWVIDVGQPLVGLIGRFDPMKDHESFLRAAAVVIGVRPDVRFVCVGDGPLEYRAALERLASDLGLDRSLLWVGPEIDVARVYNALDLCVLSSRWGEGFPNVVAEAMATGVPCVVTDVGDAAAVVGDTGWVSPPENSEELARCMTEAISSATDLAARGQQARRRVISEFGPEKLTSATAQQLVMLLDARARADR